MNNKIILTRSGSGCMTLNPRIVGSIPGLVTLKSSCKKKKMCKNDAAEIFAPQYLGKR